MPTEIIDDVLRSKLFLEWSPAGKVKPHKETSGVGRGFTYQGKTYTNLKINEKHYTASELAKAWGVSPEIVRQLFRKEPGVLRLGTPTSPNAIAGSRGHVTLRIPETVAIRVHTRLTAVPQER